MDYSKFGFELSQEFRDDRLDEPDLENVSGSLGVFELVGHGSVTNGYCGTFKCFYGCARVELHNRTTLGGKNYRNKVYVRKVFCSCDKPSCRICYKYGWAVRQARKIELRLAEASKRFGLVEHIVMTFSPKYYDLSIEALRTKAIEALKMRGIIGGVLIFHGFRFNLRQYWYWSPHFHCLGFILGGYGDCRGCKKKCFKGCGGFVDRKYRCYEKDGFIVRVLAKRKTVGGTAWYQLNHASVKKDVVRFHVATWFGVCSYRKLKFTAEYKRNVCPICQHDLVRLDYFGVKRSVLDVLFSTRTSCGERDSFEDYEEDGRVVWVERVKRKVW